MRFGQALDAMLAGARVSRAGWNGVGMFAYHVPESTQVANLDAVQGYFPSDVVPVRPHFRLKTAQNDVAVWTPSTSDILAEDWGVVPKDVTA